MSAARRGRRAHLPRRPALQRGGGVRRLGQPADALRRARRAQVEAELGALRVWRGGGLRAEALELALRLPLAHPLHLVDRPPGGGDLPLALLVGSPPLRLRRLRRLRLRFLARGGGGQPALLLLFAALAKGRVVAARARRV
ncbi:hypothetical protein AB1Y20_004548 [Prymnesium parvum]|uniref:Uncharacterized protein n=1 Tax=Prymnesium parvum TaxID=97485 RepID=A0AB34J0L8_PRYPA